MGEGREASRAMRQADEHLRPGTPPHPRPLPFSLSLSPLAGCVSCLSIPPPRLFTCLSPSHTPHNGVVLRECETRREERRRAGRKPRERARADEVRRERESRRRGHSGSEITLACSYSYELIPSRLSLCMHQNQRRGAERERERKRHGLHSLHTVL